MLPEIFFIYLGVITLLRTLYQFRTIPWIANSLVLIAFALLVYLPVAHRRIRKLPLHFFEASFPALARSLQRFALTSLALFPPFLLANHLYQGSLLHRTFHFEMTISATLLLTQILAISLPEELFFRGWFQPLLARRTGPTPAILITAALFALSHSLIALQWWHFAIFFPACVFGWLKEKTGAITASVLFHAVSNLLVAWIGVCYR